MIEFLGWLVLVCIGLWINFHIAMFLFAWGEWYTKDFPVYECDDPEPGFFVIFFFFWWVLIPFVFLARTIELYNEKQAQKPPRERSNYMKKHIQKYFQNIRKWNGETDDDN